MPCTMGKPLWSKPRALGNTDRALTWPGGNSVKEVTTELDLEGWGRKALGEDCMVQSHAMYRESQVIHFAKSIWCKPRVIGDQSGRCRQASVGKGLE